MSKPISLLAALLLAALGVSIVSSALAATNGITATPAALTFSYQLGAVALPPAQTMQVMTTPAGATFTAAVSGSPFNAAWLLVSATTGVSPASIKVQVNPTGLPPGSYAGTITLAATVGGTGVTQHVPVTLSVSAAAPTIAATPASLNFAYITGAPNPSPSLISAFVLSSSGAALPATLSVTGAPWLTVTPTGNVSLIGLLNTITVTVNPAGLAPKTYTANITIAAPGATDKALTVAVSLTVNAAPPTITGTWPNGLIQGSSASEITIEGTSYYSNSRVAATGFTPASTVTVTDGTSTISQTFYIPAYQATSTALSLAVGSPLPSGAVGTAYTQALAAAGGTAPYAYTLANGALPPGLSIVGSNFSGTPTAAGSYQAWIQVTDSSPAPIATVAPLQVTIAPAGSTVLGISTPAPLPSGTVGVAYAPVTLTASGGTGGPYTWTATNLPAGMALSAGGVLSGTPSTDGALGALTGSVVGTNAILATVPAADLATAGLLRWP